MDPTLNVEAHSRLEAVRAVRNWRGGHSLAARLVTLIVPIVAFLAWCFLVVGAAGPAQARVQIDFDPMRPPVSASPVAQSASGAAAEAPAVSALPTLKITRQTGAGLSALVDDSWVRRGDVVAGYRVTALRTESIDLVNLNDASQRLTLRLNPVTVDRNDAAKPPSSWPPLALEKK
jgi:hypothetical protein